jgi:Raf kinase inhibitor-like YbhB/YbcL family protein
LKLAMASPTTRSPAGWEPTEAVEGTNDFGNRGYGGPDPPDEPHTYRFKLYALDTTLGLAKSAGKPTVGKAMQGHRLSQTQLTGTYAP